MFTPSEKMPDSLWESNSDNEQWFYRQPGGCLEIGEIEDDGITQSIVHICSEKVDEFLFDLIAFAKKTATQNPSGLHSCEWTRPDICGFVDISTCERHTRTLTIHRPV